jgi:hypothetical protein
MTPPSLGKPYFVVTQHRSHFAHAPSELAADLSADYVEPGDPSVPSDQENTVSLPIQLPLGFGNAHIFRNSFLRDN